MASQGCCLYQMGNGALGNPAAFIRKRNERERQRVKCVNEGYALLRRHLPQELSHRRLSKVETLRAAIRYIGELQALLQPPPDRGEEEPARDPASTVPPAPPSHQGAVSKACSVSTATDSCQSTLRCCLALGADMMPGVNPILQSQGFPTLFGDTKDKNATFVIDTSENMQVHLNAVKCHLIEALLVKAHSTNHNLFNIVQFSNKVIKWCDRMVTCSPQSLYSAIQWIQSLTCSLGRDLLSALMNAFDDPGCHAIFLHEILQCKDSAG
eukprot:gi/632941768/ref/XP_007886043.1/ PREDICTED: achaete-scute homolog 3 [Callorhinchus milii]